MSAGPWRLPRGRSAAARVRAATWLLLGLATPLAAPFTSGCADDPAPAGAAEPSVLPVEITGLDADLVLPGTEARVVGQGFLPDATYRASLQGQLEGRPVTLVLDVSWIDDRTLLVAFPVEAVRNLGGGLLAGVLRIDVELAEAAGTAEA